MVRNRRLRSQALVWFAVTLPLLLSVAGLAIDAGVLLTARRELQSVADGAARAGATRLDMTRLRSSGGTDVQLDHDLAVAAANAYVLDALEDAPIDWQSPPDMRVEAGVGRVHVVIRASIRTAFLRIVRIESAPVEASAFADVEYGIRDGAGG